MNSFVRDVLKDAVEYRFSGISLFENEKFDVLKFDVESEDLIEMNRVVSASFACNDSCSIYHPHATIAYLKKGKGEKYVNLFKSYFSPTTTQTSSTIKFSSPWNDQSLSIISLRKKQLAAA